MKDKFSRRSLIKQSLTAGSVAGILAHTGLKSLLGATPSQGEGPFHPANLDSDLTRKNNGSPLATGELIYIGGRVVDEQGRAIQGALIEIWQAAANGKYNHPADPNTEPVDENFQYWGRTNSDASGRYQFKTIIPGEYPASATWTRPSHIHFRVLRRGYFDLTTQMYFKARNSREQQLLDRDNLLNSIPRNERGKLIVEFTSVRPGTGLDPSAKIGEFNIELRAV